MLVKKNTKAGKIRIVIFLIVLFLPFIFLINLYAAKNLEGNFTNLKVLDKISSKNVLLRLKNGEETKHKDLLIKSI